MSPPHPGIAATPVPPYWVVVFTSQRHTTDPEGYAAMAAHLDALARAQPGYLGAESVREPSGLGITVSYWASEGAIAAWKQVAIHAEAQRTGRARWYADYALRVARVERAYTLADSPQAGL